MTNHAMTATIKAAKAAPTRPPTSPPAIPPVFELLCEVEVGVDDEPLLSEVVVGVDDELAEVALDVIDPWDCPKLVIFPPLSWNWPKTEAVPVTSGESPAACAPVRSQVSVADESRYAHSGIRVPAAIGGGKVPALPILAAVQWSVHSE